MERGALTPVFGFEDVADSSTFFWALTEGEGTEEVDMQLSDTNSLRLGLEYLASNRENFKLPVRLGFRKEKLTRNNILVPQEYPRQDQRILAYCRQLISGDPSAEVTETQLADLFEHNILMFQGTPINTTVISLGAGVEIDNFGADLGIELQNFTINNFFLDDYDPLTNNLPPTITEETRRLLTMSIAVRWKF